MNFFWKTGWMAVWMLIAAALVAIPVQAEKESGTEQTIPAKRTFNHPPFGGKLSDPFYFNEQYDPRKDLTGVVVHTRIVETESNELYLGFLFNYKGKEIATPEEVVVLFHSFSENWLFMEKTDAVLMADGQTINLGFLKRDPVESPMGISEHLFQKIRIDLFLSIINSRKVEGRVGNVLFTLTEEQLEAFRDFASHMKK